MSNKAYLSILLIYGMLHIGYSQVNLLRSDFFYADSSEYYSRWLFPDWYLVYKQFAIAPTKSTIVNSFQF